MKKRIALSLAFFIMIACLFACQSEGETLVLLDEKIVEIGVSQSLGIQLTDESETEMLYTFTEPKDIAVFEKALTTAVLHNELTASAEPEFNVYIHYEENLPVHAFHLWLGNENDKSMLMYMIDETENMYVVSSEMSKQLRSLFQ